MTTLPDGYENYATFHENVVFTAYWALAYICSFVALVNVLKQLQRHKYINKDITHYATLVAVIPQYIALYALIYFNIIPQIGTIQQIGYVLNLITRSCRDGTNVYC